MITLEDYFGAFFTHPDATSEKKNNAVALLVEVNALRDEAEADGVQFATNPHTGNFVSGNGHGGFRPEICSVGADNSTHKDGNGVDNYDPNRVFAKWCRTHEERLAARGLYMEREEWTPTWVHLQRVPPRSGKIAYIPSSAPPAASSLV